MAFLQGHMCPRLPFGWCRISKSCLLLDRSDPDPLLILPVQKRESHGTSQIPVPVITYWPERLHSYLQVENLFDILEHSCPGRMIGLPPRRLFLSKVTYPSLHELWIWQTCYWKVLSTIPQWLLTSTHRHRISFDFHTQRPRLAYPGFLYSIVLQNASHIPLSPLPCSCWALNTRNINQACGWRLASEETSTLLLHKKIVSSKPLIHNKAH